MMEVELGKYGEALEAQMELWRFWHSIEGQKVAAIFRQGVLRERGAAPTVSWFQRGQIHTIEQAESYYVAPTICELLEQSLDSLPDTPLRNFQIPSVAGWVYFALPRRVLEYPDMSEAGSHLCGFSWHQQRELKEVEVEIFNHFVPDSIAITFYQRPSNSLWLVPSAYLEWPLDAGWERTSKYRGLVGFVRSYKHALAVGEEVEFANAVQTTMRQYVVAFFAFIIQTIAATIPTKVSRPTQRRLERARLLIEPIVRIVKLRRKEYQQSSETQPVDWSCRWIVRAHWRNQYYPSTGFHRPKLIPAYVKGPEDKPLKKPNIPLFAVVR